VVNAGFDRERLFHALFQINAPTAPGPNTGNLTVSGSGRQKPKRTSA